MTTLVSRAACPKCSPTKPPDETRKTVRKAGFFRRSSDAKRVQRFQCTTCSTKFSNATFNARKWQKKRLKNHLVRDLLCSAVSQRRAAKILNLTRKTVARKAVFLGREAERKMQAANAKFPPATHVQFDDQETFEHTKLKPLSITLMVTHPERRFLGFQVSQMPASGHLAKKSRAKYGPRPDRRRHGRRRLFEAVRHLVAPDALIESDQNPHYVPDVRRHFPNATHVGHKGRRGSIVGQGELKKIGFDPLFSLNHTCAMNRASISRLVRRTWATTKLSKNLALHLAMYAEYHNSELIESTVDST